MTRSDLMNVTGTPSVSTSPGRVVLPPGTKRQNAHQDSFRHGTRSDRGRLRVRGIRGGAGNRQEQERHLRLLIDTEQIARLLARNAETNAIVHDVVPKDGLPTTIDAYPIAFVCNTGSLCMWVICVIIRAIYT